jgi:hypothetical protein
MLHMPITVSQICVTNRDRMRKEARTVYSEGAMFEHSETQWHVCCCVCMCSIREIMYHLKVVH